LSYSDIGILCNLQYMLMLTFFCGSKETGCRIPDRTIMVLTHDAKGV